MKNRAYLRANISTFLVLKGLYSPFLFVHNRRKEVMIQSRDQETQNKMITILVINSQKKICTSVHYVVTILEYRHPLSKNSSEGGSTVRDNLNFS